MYFGWRERDKGRESRGTGVVTMSDGADGTDPTEVSSSYTEAQETLPGGPVSEALVVLELRVVNAR